MYLNDNSGVFPVASLPVHVRIAFLYDTCVAYHRGGAPSAPCIPPLSTPRPLPLPHTHSPPQPEVVQDLSDTIVSGGVLGDSHQNLLPEILVLADTNCSALIASLRREHNIAAVVATVGMPCRRALEAHVAADKLKLPLLFAGQGFSRERDAPPPGANVFVGMAPPRQALSSMRIFIEEFGWTRPVILSSEALSQATLSEFSNVNLARNVVYGAPLSGGADCQADASVAMTAAQAARTPLILVDVCVAATCSLLFLSFVFFLSLLPLPPPPPKSHSPCMRPPPLALLLASSASLQRQRR